LQCKNEVDVLLAQFTPEWLDGFIGDGIEPVEERFFFSTIQGSENFIEKFMLNNHEQNLIGSWIFISPFSIISMAGSGQVTGGGSVGRVLV